MTTKTLVLGADEYEHIITTLEGALEEFEELEKDVPWFTSLTTERLVDSLSILKRKYEE